MNSSTSKATINKLRQTFANHGLPKTIVMDNGTPLVSSEFQTFCKLNGIQHLTVATYHPSSNGLAERVVQTIKDGLKRSTNGSLESRLYNFLLSYNITPHGTNKEPPSVNHFTTVTRNSGS